jgi:hypothetical protein
VQSLAVLFVLGALGLALKRAGWPRAPFAIGLVLGGVAERAFHQAWALWGPRFVLRPGAVILLLLIGASVMFYVARSGRGRARRDRDLSSGSGRDRAWLAALLLAVFLGMTAAAVGYPWPARMFPLVVGSAGTLLCVVELGRRLAAADTRSSRTPSGSPDGRVEMLLWFGGALALVVAAGVVAGGAAFVALFLRLREREAWRVAVSSGLALGLMLHVVLERAFGIDLFNGLLLT